MLIPAGNNHRSSPSPSWASHVKKHPEEVVEGEEAQEAHLLVLLNIDHENNPCLKTNFPTSSNPLSARVYVNLLESIQRDMKGIW